MTTMQIDQELDTRGLNCPLPILKAKKALTGMQSGQLLKVISTDQGSLRDFAAFAKQTGNELLEQQTVGSDFIHLLRRAIDDPEFVKALNDIGLKSGLPPTMSLEPGTSMTRSRRCSSALASPLAKSRN